MIGGSPDWATSFDRSSVPLCREGREINKALPFFIYFHSINIQPISGFVEGSRRMADHFLSQHTTVVASNGPSVQHSGSFGTLFVLLPRADTLVLTRSKTTLSEQTKSRGAERGFRLWNIKLYLSRWLRSLGEKFIILTNPTWRVPNGCLLSRDLFRCRLCLRSSLKASNGRRKNAQTIVAGERTKKWLNASQCHQIILMWFMC